MPIRRRFYHDLHAVMGIKQLFNLDEKEIRQKIKKRKGSPNGKLREFYPSKDNYEVITKVATSFFFSIIWDVIEGHSFYLPMARKPSIYVGHLPQDYLINRRKAGLYRMVDLKMWNYKVPSIRIASTNYKIKKDHILSLNGEFLSVFYNKIITGDKVGGKKPKYVKDYLPDLYERFVYISEESINFIIKTFCDNFKIILNKSAKVSFSDGLTWMLAHPPRVHESKNYYERWRKKEARKALDKKKEVQKQKEYKEIFKDVTSSK